jgi:uncharacterized membrane protein
MEMNKKAGLPENKNKLARILMLILGSGLVMIWLVNTPPGLLGKSDAVAYAICHRIGSHSFHLGERAFSLCARCSGEYLGFLWGFIFHLFFAKDRYNFPTLKTLLALGVLFLFFVFDGINSFFHLYPGLEQFSLYTPQNFLRLFSGLGMGVLISVILYPLLGQTLFKEQVEEVTFTTTRDWFLLIGGAALIGLLVLADNPLLAYPLILISTGGLLTLLTILYTVIWVLILKKENSFGNWMNLAWWGVGGFFTAILQVALIDLIRFLLTGTWSGFLVY